MPPGRTTAVLLTTCSQCSRRSLHRLAAPTVRIPKPTPFVPDVPTFLTLIGRNMSAHAAKLPSWEALFTLSSAQLKESGLEPARARKYLLWWRERFRNGIIGPGGDLKQVQDGVAELRIAEVPSENPGNAAATMMRSAGMRKMVVNTLPRPPPEAGTKRSMFASLLPPMRLESAAEAIRVAGVKIVRANVIGGPGVEGAKGRPGVAILKAKDGLWEQRRGHKVDGGERRKAEVRAKRRAQERKNAR